MISKTSITEEGGYPREDKCRWCGEHLGFVMDPMGDVVALGCCDNKECRRKQEKYCVGD